MTIAASIVYLTVKSRLSCCRGPKSGGAADEADPEDNKENEPAKKAKRRKQAKALNRPLIAVCNDLYAPALRPLRAVARVLQFSQPQASPCKSAAV